jgi:hypothetical protein
MNGKNLFRVPSFCLIWVVIFMNPLHAAPITVTDQNGRAIEIELVSAAGESVTFRRTGDAKEFTLPVSSFARESQELIRKEASQIPVVLPKIRPDVVIGKRRHRGDSYYMVTQEITATVKLTNPHHAIPIPTVKGKIIFIGQDRRTPELFSILSTQSVEAPIKAGETVTQEMEGFLTSYDSDNKGSGNIGGAQYFGFILVMADEAGNVVVDYTTTGSFRQAMTNKPAVLKELITYPKGKMLTQKLDPAPISRNIGIRP